MAKKALPFLTIIGLSATIVFTGAKNVSAVDFSSTISKAALEGVYSCFEGTKNDDGSSKGDGAYVNTFLASQGAEAMMYSGRNKAGDIVKLPYGLTDAADNNTDCKQIMFGFGGQNGTLNHGLIPEEIQGSGVDKDKLRLFFAGSDNSGGDGTMGWSAAPEGNVEDGQPTSQLVYTLAPESEFECRDSNGTSYLNNRYFYDTTTGQSYPSIIFPMVTKDNTGSAWKWGDTASSMKNSNVPEPGSFGFVEYSFCGDKGKVTIRDQDGGNQSVYYAVEVWIHSVARDQGTGNIIDEFDNMTFSSIVNPLADEGYEPYTQEPNLLQTFHPREFHAENIKGTTGNESSSADFDDYRFTWASGGFMRPIKKLNDTNNAGVKVSGLSTYGSLKLTEQEVYDLYTYYITNVYKKPVKCEGDENYDNYTSFQEINWAKGKHCYIDKDRATTYVDHEVYGVDPDATSAKYMHFVKKLDSIDEVINMLNKIDIDKLTTQTTGTSDNIDDLLNPEDPRDPTVYEDGDTEPSCTSNAGELGWIICPIIKAASTFIQDFYEGWIEPFLILDSTLFSGELNGHNYTYEAWQKFQMMANLAFVVLFLFVIFSQLTGVGIDNYGIKKILPKLIIAAVLINMSYIICELAVDISNILGMAMKNLFASITPNMSDVTIAVNGTSPVGAWGARLAVVAIVAGIAVAAVLAMGWGVLIPILLLVLSVIISLFFLFFMLGIRQAMAVILVVISPLAFVCYMLPNTKKLFDKWVDIFKAMLIAYPICSAMVYGGDMVAKILVSANAVAGTGDQKFISSLGLLVTAAIISIAPVFFIPGLIKKGLSGISAVGNMLNRTEKLGGKVSDKARTGLNDHTFMGDSKAYRQQRMNDNRNARRGEYNYRRAQRTMDRLGKDKDGKPVNPTTLSARKRAAYNAARRTDMSYRKEQSELADNYYSSLSMDNVVSNIESSFANGNLEMTTSGLEQLGNIDQGALLDTLEKISGTEKWKKMSDKERTTIMATLRGMKGNPIAQAYAKILGNEKSGSVRSMTAVKGEIQKKVQEMGDAAVTGTDKDVWKWIAGNSDTSWATESFDGNQMAKFVRDGQSGVVGDRGAQVMAVRAQAGLDDLKYISGEDLAAGGTVKMAAALTGEYTAEEIGSMDTTATGAIKSTAAGTVGADGKARIAPGKLSVQQAIKDHLSTKVDEIQSSPELSARVGADLATVAKIDKRNRMSTDVHNMAQDIADIVKPFRAP